MLDPLNQVMKYVGKGVKVTFNVTNKTFKYALTEGAEFVRDSKIIIKSSSTLSCGIPLLDIKIIRKGNQFTKDEVEKLTKQVNDAIDKQGGLDKLPKDEFGNRLVEIDVDNNKITAVVGSETSLDKFGKEQIKAIIDVRLSDFITKSLNEKLALIADSWKKYYPEIFIERSWFEDAMGYYRYTPNEGWSHTSYIADNFKAVDFYKKTNEVGNNIFTETVVSMKTTTTKNVDDWLKTSAIDNNIKELKIGLNDGIEWSNKNIQYNRAELHIYVPEENLSEIRAKWLNTLRERHPEINFEMSSIEDFIK